MKLWTPNEVTRLLELKPRFKCKEIAQMLGRTETSVRIKLLDMGLSSRQTRVNPLLRPPDPLPVPERCVESFSAAPTTPSSPISEPVTDSYDQIARRQLKAASGANGSATV